MNEENDPLEEELAALRPHEVSPGLQRRVAERLAHSLATRRRWLWGVALTGGLAAAGVAAAVLLGRRDGPEVETGRTPDPVPLVIRGLGDEALPTLLVYQRALARSAEELDALLDKHAGRTSSLDPPGAHVGAFARSAVELRTWLGEP